MSEKFPTPPGKPGRPFSDRQLAGLLELLAGEEQFVFLESSRITPENHRSLLFLRPLRLLTLPAAQPPTDFFAAIEAELARGHYLAGWFAYELGYLLEPRLRPLLPTGAEPLAVLGVFAPPLIYDHRQGTWQLNGHGAPLHELLPPSGAEPAHRPEHAAPSGSPLPAQPGTAKPGAAAHDHLTRETPEQPSPAASGQRPGFNQPLNPRFSVDAATYQRHVEQIRRYIEAGDTYQVNYTLKQRLDYADGDGELYQALRRGQRVCYGALLRLAGRSVLSFSPELFFRCADGRCQVRPMKGTCRRGLTPEEDEKLARFLREDEKNRSENVMIVDLLRNDLGRICRPGSVKTTALFQVESYETLHQMTTTIQGSLRPDLSCEDIFRALFPCGSVTGAPKIRTMEIIRELEGEPRGVYTGALGFIAPVSAQQRRTFGRSARLKYTGYEAPGCLPESAALLNAYAPSDRQVGASGERFIAPHGEMVFNVPIRTVVRETENTIGMGIGSGIVYDSQPEKEWRECQLKGNFLRQPPPDLVLIETMLWQPELGYRLLDLHLERLLASAAALYFQADRQEIVETLQQLAAGLNQPSRVRLTLAKDGTLTLSQAPFGFPPVVGGRPFPCFSPADLPPPAANLPTVTISRQGVDPSRPLLYHKTSCRELYDREREAALAAGHCEVLFCNQRGELTEGAISNLFIRRRGRLLTPPLNAGLLNGVLRRHLLRRREAEEATIRPEELAAAEAIFIGNSLRGLTRVRLPDAR